MQHGAAPGPSQLPRLATGRVAVTNGYSHRMFQRGCGGGNYRRPEVVPSPEAATASDSESTDPAFASGLSAVFSIDFLNPDSAHLLRR